MSNSRLEKFIYAICGMDVDDLPTPLSRIETLWNCLITGEMPDFEPLSRNEKYLMVMLNGDIDGLPEPTSRSEKLLYKIATGETDLSDVPGYLSRYEELLKQLIESGGIGGTDFEYVLYTLNQPLSTLYSTAEDTVNTVTIYGDTVVNTLQEPSDLAVTPIGENIDISNTTVDGTVEGKVKSAILKGQTLVNLLKFDELDSKTNKVGDTITVTNGTDTSAWYGGRIHLTKSIERNKKYIAMWDNLEWTHTHVNGKMGVIQVLTKNASTNRDLKIEQTGNDDRNYMIFSCTDENADLSKVQIAVLATSWATGEANNLTTIKGLKVLEYQEGMENWDIPYFEGMQSVKMPVLTTTGKNLFDVNNAHFVSGLIHNANLTINATANTNAYYILCEPNTSYTITKGLTSYFRICETTDVPTIGCKVSNLVNNPSKTSLSITTSDSAKYLCFNIHNTSTDTVSENEILGTVQIEKGTVATAYEPYKSNILTCNEEVTLRGIDDVKDELDLTSGELTPRISEIVLDGSEDWKKSSWTNDSYFIAYSSITSNLAIGNTKAICSKLPSGDVSSSQTTEAIKISGDSTLRISVSTSKASSIEEFNSWLQNEKPSIYFISKEPVIKTVDLSIIDQDGKETSHLHTFNDTTHISTSAECLLPNVVIPADISYPSIIKANTLYTVKLKRPVTNGNLLINLGGTEQLVTSDCFTIQTPATLTSQNVIFSGKGNVISEVTVVEGDHTEKEYGYFEGMMSVQMPVLTTTGKNLFDSTFNYGFISDANGIINTNAKDWLSSDYVKLNKGTYTIGSDEPFNGAKKIAIYDDNKAFIKTTTPTTFTLEGDRYIRIGIKLTSSGNILENQIPLAKIQIEKGTTATSYEPFKSSILTTTSKNLFDMNRPYDVITDSQATVVQDTNQITVSSSAESGIYVNANFILDKDFFAGKTVTGSCLYESDEKDIGTVQITYQDGDGEYHYQWIKTPTTFTFPNSFIGDVMLSISANNTGTPQSNTVTVKNIQLELGSTATPYEPYSEVVLRGIGEVKDELNLLTGELTERIGEVVLDGTNTPNIMFLEPNRAEGYTVFPMQISDVFPNMTANYNINTQLISNNFNYLVGGYLNRLAGKWMCINAMYFVLSISNDELESFDIQGLNKWLSLNKTTIYYPSEKSVKTVVLSTLDQDGQPTKLKTFNDVTHVSIEAEDLLPTVDLEVPTKIEETLSTLPTLMNDISETQQLLSESIDDQAEDINEVSTAITEIHNDIL